MSKEIKVAAAGLPGRALADYSARNFKYKLSDGVACITLDRPERRPIDV